MKSVAVLWLCFVLYVASDAYLNRLQANAIRGLQSEVARQEQVIEVLSDAITPRSK